MTAPRILVVEDERIVALHLRQKLTSLGYNAPLAVATGEAALRAIKEAPPDLVLMDIHLEGKLDGIETTALIPPEYHVPVIYLTAYSEDATLKRASATNAHGYLLKPFSERELHTMVRMTLARCLAERASREAGERLRQAREMEAIGKVTGGIAHDFNNLLTIIFGNLEELGDHTAGDPKMAELVRGVFSAAMRGEKLIQQLLEFSQCQLLSLATISPSTFISSMGDGLSQTLSGGIIVQPFLSADLWKIRIDTDGFERALLNLADNARDAMPEGGTLTITGRNVTLDPPRARALSDEVAPGCYVLLAVSDTGAGMAEGVAKKAFEPFFTTKPPGHGSGLGLSQVFGFIRQSGGHVGIDTKPGLGTTINMYLPAVENEGVVVEPPGALVQEMPVPPGETALVVDTEPMVRGQAADILKGMGYDTIEAASGAAACRILESNKRIHLLFTGAVMSGGMNGAMLAREALARQPDLKVLYMSGYSLENLIDDGVLTPGVPLLRKPFRRVELMRKVREILDMGMVEAEPLPAVLPAVLPAMEA